MPRSMHGSLTSRLALSRSAVDRDYLTRSRPGLLDELRADPRTRAVVLSRGASLLADAPPPRLELLPLTALAGADVLVYLGRALEGDAAGAPIVAAALDDA